MADKHYSGIGISLHARVDGIPAALSGAQIFAIIDEERLFCKDYTGADPGSPSVSEQYVGAITDLAASNLTKYMQTIGADASSVSLGEFSVDKSGETNLSKASDSFRVLGMEKLKRIGRGIGVRRSIGGV